MDNRQRQILLDPTQRLVLMAVCSKSLREVNRHLRKLKTCASVFTYNGLITLEMAIKRRRRCMKLFRQAYRGFCV